MAMLPTVPVRDRALSRSLVDCSLQHSFVYLLSCSFLAIETGWALGSFAAVLALGHLSFSNKIQRNYMGLKITMCTVRDNSRQKVQREQKTQMPFLRSLE